MAIEILIVDDNSDIRNILNELIIDAGYKTRIAANYNQALSEIDKKIALPFNTSIFSNFAISLIQHIFIKNGKILMNIIQNLECLMLNSYSKR